MYADARHLSCVETGKSQPSREMIGRLAGALAMPLRELNALLIAGGYAPGYPETALRKYIAGKLRFSREHPYDSRVYANEVISGAPLFAQEIRDRVVPALQADIAVFNRWAELGICRPIDAAHLMVVLWASTQAYADFASQISLVLGKAELEPSDFAAAETLLVDMVLRTVLAHYAG